MSKEVITVENPFDRSAPGAEGREARRFWSRITQAVEPYVPGEQPRERLIKLNTNENPYPPSPAVAAALNAVDPARLRLYPDPTSLRLRQSIGAYFNLPESQVFVGNGSDEILAFCFQAFFNPGEPAEPADELFPDEPAIAVPDGLAGPWTAEAAPPAGPPEQERLPLPGLPGPSADQVVFPDITYSFYPVYARLYGIPFRTVPLLPDMGVPLAELSAPSAGIVLANPNAPTGCALPLEALEALAESDPDRLLIVDEAYVDFGADSAVSLLGSHDNILVVQTFSKSRSLAGVRLGFALGAPALIEGLERIRDSFNSYTVDCLAQLAGEAAMADGAWFEETRRRIIATRDWTVQALTALGFEVIPSQANFIFARHPAFAGRFLQQELRRRGILVRRFDRPRIADYLRISIGTDAEMQALAEATAAVLGFPVAGAGAPAL